MGSSNKVLVGADAIDLDVVNGGEEEEEEEEGDTMKTFVADKLRKFFIDHLPIESFAELDPTYMYYFGTVAYILAISLFSYFTYISYEGAKSQAFISLDEDSGDCSSVAITVHGSYLADTSGSWVGTSDFTYSYAPYQLHLSGFEATEDQYTAMMQTFKTALDRIGKAAIVTNLAYNLVYWMTFVEYYSVQFPDSRNFTDIGHGQLQFFEMTGNAKEVYDVAYQQMHFISRQGYCSLSSITQFDQSNGVIYTYLNETVFRSAPNCIAAVEPSKFGYLENIDKDTFKVQMEVTAFATAMSINLGDNTINNLELAGSAGNYLTLLGVTYKVAQFFDPRFPNMDPMLCVYNVTIGAQVAEMCMVVVGTSVALPVFNHFGNSKYYPEYCDCNTVGHSTNCNLFNLMSGLVYYPTDEAGLDIADMTIDLMRLRAKFDTYHDFNYAAYNASWAASAHVYESERAYYTSSQFYNDSFAFCKQSGDVYCALAVFNSLDLVDQKVSPFKYQLPVGSCVNSFTIEEANWGKLEVVPPVALTQDYFECYQDTLSALLDSLGIASGNTGLAVPILVLILLPVLYLLLVAVRQVPPKQEYTSDEKDEAIAILALLLLRLRDGKTRGVKSNGVLMKLTKELITAAKEDGGYPDSDDEEDSDADTDDDNIDGSTDGTTLDKKLPNANRIRKAKDGRSHTKSSVSSDSGDEEEARDDIERISNAARAELMIDSDDEEGYDIDEADPDGTHEELRQSLSMKFAPNSIMDGDTPSKGRTKRSKRKSKREISNINTNSSAGQATLRANTTSRGPSKGRKKMGVFTRHIDAKEAAAAAANASSSTARSARARTTSAAAVAGDERGASAETTDYSTAAFFGSMFTAAFFNSTENTNSDQNANRNRARSSLEGQEMVNTAHTSGSNPMHCSTQNESHGTRSGYQKRKSSIVSKSSLADISEGIVPTDVQVFNLPDDYAKQTAMLRKKQFKRAPSQEDVDVWVDDLLQLFGEALEERNSTCEEQSSKLTMAQAADSEAFQQAKTLSQKLALVPFDEFFSREDRTVFLKLSNALCMHASIELRCEMRQIAQEYSDRVAYNIGGKIFTARHLMKSL